MERAWLLAVAAGFLVAAVALVVRAVCWGS